MRYMPATNGQQEYRHQDRDAVEDPAVASLMQWGWPPAACVEALARLHGSPEDAHQDLFGRLTGGGCCRRHPLYTTNWWPTAGGSLSILRGSQSKPTRAFWDSWQVKCSKPCRDSPIVPWDHHANAASVQSLETV